MPLVLSTPVLRPDGSELDVVVSCRFDQCEIHFRGTDPYEPQRCINCGRELVPAEAKP